MRNKIRVAVMVLVCMGMLLVQAVPSYAEDDHECDGGCVKIVENTYNIRYSSTGGTTHKKSWTQDTKCKKCGAKRKEQMETYEGCNWVSYTDLGHQTGQDHRYRLTCGTCGGNYEITITTCEAEWKGWHVTPW